MAEAGKFLGPPMTAGYRPAVLGYGMIQSLYTGQVPLFMLGEVEAMRSDPQVQLANALLRAPLQRLKWTVKAQRSDIGSYVDAQFRRVWQTSVRKMMHHVEYGNACGEPLYREEDGHVIFDQLRDVYPRDAIPLVQEGAMVGVQVKGNAPVPSEAGAPNAGIVNLFPPRCFWVAHRARYGSYYGYSRYNGGWWPWLEKRGRHGATDIRRGWYIKNAFRGMRIRHPPGMIERPDGSLQSCQDYAREIVEKCEAGGVLALPNAKDPITGEYLWVVEDAQVNGDLSGVREYSGDLDGEILQGFEIPPEVARAAEVGSGWSGRSVPFLVFLAGEDEIVAELIHAITLWILRPLVWVNFGPGHAFEIVPTSLVELLGEAADKGDGSQGGAAPRPGQPAGPPPSADRPPTAQRVQMSLEGDRGATESASRIVEGIIDQGARAGVLAGDEVRRRIRALVKKKWPVPRLIDAARKIIAAHEPVLAGAFGDSLLAAWLAGAARATEGLPPVPAPGTAASSSAPPAGQEPPPPLLSTSLDPGEPEPVVRFPIIELAARDMATRRLMERAEFDQLASDARNAAFTVARVAGEESLHRLAAALSQNVAEGGTLREFAAAVDEALGEGGLSPGHVENVFRTNVSAAYTTGLMEVLAHPLVADEFPYLAYHAVHDSRVRPDHLALERHGLDGSNVYRRDDPIWERFSPPWDYQCRCAIVPLSVEDAAAAGVREAQDWLQSGEPPLRPSWVPAPPFDPPAGWGIRPTVRMSRDEEGNEHDKRGRFAPKGGGASAPVTSAHAVQAAQAKLEADVGQMKETPEGRATLQKGQAVAARVKAGIAGGVKAALDALDAESKGGISLLAGALKSKDPAMAAAGAAHLFNSVFQCVHEEVWENALSQHSIPGAHAVGMVASSLAVKAEQGLLKATAWAWGKISGKSDVRMSLAEHEDKLTPADRQLLGALADVAAQAVRDIYRDAGLPDVTVNDEAAARRILELLRKGPAPAH